MRAPGDISIGDLSRRTGCNIETIRYYERIGLLPRPRRPGGRFRRYDGEDIARLAFVRRARQLGFTLDDIRDLLRLATAAPGDADVCTEARALAAAQLGEIRAKIADLQAMKRVLADAVRRCDAGEASRCPIIETLRGRIALAAI